MKLFSLSVFGVLAASATDITTSTPGYTTTTTPGTTTSTTAGTTTSTTPGYTTTTTPGYTTTTTPGYTTTTTPGYTTTTTPGYTTTSTPGFTTTTTPGGSKPDEFIEGIWDNLERALLNNRAPTHHLRRKWRIKVIRKWHSRYYYLANVGAAYGNSCVFDGRTFDMTISDTNNVCLVSEAYLLGITNWET